MSNALSDIPGQFFQAMEIGQQQRDRTTRRNALAAYAAAPAGDTTAQGNALQPLVAAGDFETLRNVRERDAGVRQDQTRQQIAPMAARGDFVGASRQAAAGGQLDMASAFMGMDRSQLDAARTRGERGASVLYAAIALPDPQQRAAYVAQHPDLAAELGVTPEILAQTDWNNTGQLQALADGWQDAAKMAGDVSLQRFGDNVQTVRTSNAGTKVLDSREIPQTRAEGFERQQFDYRRQQDQVDNNYRQSRAEAEDTYRAWQMQNAASRSDIEGQVLQSAIRNGYEALSPEEKQIYDKAVSTSSSGGFGLGEWGAPPANPQGGAPGQATAPAASTPPRQAPATDPFPGIAEGQIVEQGGKAYQRRGSQMIEVR